MSVCVACVYVTLLEKYGVSNCSEHRIPLLSKARSSSPGAPLTSRFFPGVICSEFISLSPVLPTCPPLSLACPPLTSAQAFPSPIIILPMLDGIRATRPPPLPLLYSSVFPQTAVALKPCARQYGDLIVPRRQRKQSIWYVIPSQSSPSRGTRDLRQKLVPMNI